MPPSTDRATRRPVKKTAKKTTKKPAAKRSAAKKPAAKRAATKKPAAKRAATKKPAAKRTATKKPPAKRAATKKPAAKRTATKKTAKKAPAKRSAAKKPAAKRAATKKPAAKRAATKKPAAKRTATKKPPAKRTATKKPAAKRTAAKKPAAKKTAKKAPAKRSTKQAVKKTTRKPAKKRASTNHSPGVATLRAPAKSGSSRPSPRRSARSRSLPVTERGERYAAYLTLAFVGLTLFGLVMVLSASSVPSLHQLEASPFYQFRKQALWAVIGAIAFVVLSRVDYRRLRPLAAPLLGLSLVLLAVLLLPGVGREVNGSTRWLAVGPVSFQPSELAKLSVIIFVAELLTKRERRMDRPELTVRPVMLSVFATSILLLLQPKLGTPIILAAVALLMLFVAGAQLRSMLLWIGVSVGSTLLIALSTGYQNQRIVGWLDPWADPQGSGAQLIQSWVGIASGGWFGQGLGASRAKWGFLPEAQTDFIFAVVAEETGLVGASALIGAFALIAWIGIRVALAAPDRFGMLLAAGITGWLLIQAFLNIGMVVGVLPITGEALPFVSAGGSSLMTALAAAGLLVGIARRARNDP